jgi:hypothetical protein
MSDQIPCPGVSAHGRGKSDPGLHEAQGEERMLAGKGDPTLHVVEGGDVNEALAKKAGVSRDPVRTLWPFARHLHECVTGRRTSHLWGVGGIGGRNEPAECF